jgi:hypothetical protein
MNRRVSKYLTVAFIMLICAIASLAHSPPLLVGAFGGSLGSIVFSAAAVKAALTENSGEPFE